LKKFVFISFLIVLLFVFIDYKYTQFRNRDINYVIERHFTTGIFRKNKMSSIESYQLSFSDNNTALVTIEGTEKKIPNKKVSYKILLQKRKNGTWKVKRVLLNS
jgi:hypothetical protein